MSSTLRAVVAALALAVPVGAELIWSSLGDSGHVWFAASQVVGWLLVVTVVRDGARRGAGDVGRGGRVGRTILLAGCALEVLFGAVYGVTALIDGEPMEASFALFALGFLATFVGGLMWGWALLRGRGSRLAAGGVLATAVLGLLAIMVGVDPFHDVFLLSSYAAWVLVGRGLEVPATAPATLSASSR